MIASIKGRRAIFEQQAFEALLEVQDPVIYAYCLGQSPVPAHLQSLIRLITDR